MASSKERENEVTVKVEKTSSPEELSSRIAGLSLNEAATTVILEEALGGALALKASDIHFEPTKELVKIRVRIDGVLREAGALVHEDYKYLLSRIKLLSGTRLNIQETAQDGRFTIINREDGASIETRVSISPSEHGATVVMRLLDPRMAIVDVKSLGLRSDDFEKIERNLKKPNGMILVTGPTGSGKTTTLYSFINSINSSEIKIITIEEPVEYHLEGVQQTQVDESAGYSFANGLESILRQDPDVILVGEIRDSETAGIAIQAALTGHIVFSTLHTNTAAGAIPRLIDLEVKPHVIGPSINVILAQRLVRKLCPHCRKKAELSGEYADKIAKFISSLPKNIKLPEAELYEPVGCSVCIDGYKGRTGIFEVFEIDKDIERLIHEESSEVDIESKIVEKGFVNMQRDGIIKALAGTTSLAEVERATGPLDW